MLSLIRELAEFEFEPDAVEATADDLRAALFAADPGVFAHVAITVAGEEVDGAVVGEEVDGAAVGEAVVGAAVWYVTYSTWTARHGIHLTDLVVTADARQGGHGEALFGELVRICTERGYSRLDWETLDALVDSTERREPHGFYRRQGAQAREGWTAWRMDADALARHPAGVAVSAPTPPPPSV